MKTLILWLDAFRHDYLNEKDTPFLYSIVSQFELGHLKPVFGYSSIGASFFTGVYPYRHDQFTIYCRGDKLINNRLLGILPVGLRSYYYNFNRYLKGEDFFIPLISYKYSRNFQISQNRYYHNNGALPVKTLFNVLNEKGLKFVAYNWPLIATNDGSRLSIITGADDRAKTKKFIELCKKDYDVYFMHLWDLDKYGHIYGPISENLKTIIREQDKMVEKIINNFSIENDNILIWSDHGMLEVKNTIDMSSILPEFGDEYLYFLDSTLARFWFFNDGKRKEVIDILNNIRCGHILSDSEKDKFNINFGHNRYGEEIFLADPGNLIVPNFFQDRPIKGMHGYDLSEKNEWGMFIANKRHKEEGTVVDMFPTIMEMMNIDYGEIVDGKSLIK